MKIEKTNNYIKITADDGCVITNYKEGNDILTYTSCKVMYAPKTADLSGLRDISAEDNNKYEELRLKAENGR